MPAVFRIAVPSATPSPPIQLASSGFPVRVGVSRHLRWRLAVGSASPCGAMMASNPSLAGSLETMSTAFTKRSASASAKTSTGLWRLQCEERKLSNSCSVVGREHGQLSAGSHESVGGQHTRSAGIGDDAEARSARTRLLAESLCHIKEVGDVLHAQHAATAEGSFENVIASGQRSGVGRGSAGSGLGASGFDHDDRLAESNLARRRKERSRVAHRLHVNENALGVGIVAEVINEIAPADIEHRAGRNDRAEAHVLLLAPIENRRLQCAALAEESHAAFFRHGLREGGVEADRGIHESHAVGPDQAQRSALQMLFDFLFQQGAIGPLLAKSGRNDDRRFHPGVDALADDLRHGLRRRYNQRQIDSAGNVRNPLLGLDSRDLRMAWIDGINLERELAFQQIGNDAASDGAGPVCGSNHSHGSRQEQGLKRSPSPVEVRCRFSQQQTLRRGLDSWLTESLRADASLFHKDRRLCVTTSFSQLHHWQSVLSHCGSRTYPRSQGLVMVVTPKSAQVHSNRKGGAAKCAPLTVLIFLIIALLVRYEKSIFFAISRFMPDNDLTK